MKVDLAGQDDEALARLQLHHNDWYVRTARRLLQERAAAGRDLSTGPSRAPRDPGANPDVTRQLRAIWALYATGGLDEKAALRTARSPERAHPGLGRPAARRSRTAGTRHGDAISPSWPRPIPARKSG